MISDGLSRRTFVKVTGALGAGLVLGCRIEANESPEAEALEPNAFVHIDTKGKVTIVAPRPDIGTGVRTSLAMLVAEELGVDLDQVHIAQAPGDRQKYGGQGIGGSGAVRGSFTPLRVAGASAALILRRAAAAKWGVGVETCSIEAGTMKSGSKRDSIGAFVADAAKLPIPTREEVTLKPKSEFKLIGKPTKRVDNLDVVTGKAKYGLDTKLPGMKMAMIARPPAFGGSASSFDEAAARKIDGVRDVFAIPSGICVVADDTWRAHKGIEALAVKWDAGPNGELSTGEISKSLKAAIQAFPELSVAPSKVLEATYEFPFLSHSPMEPQNCTAEMKGDKVEIWAPTQLPDSARDMVARQLSIAPENVTLNVTLIGGGFGRRLSQDYITEAVQIAQKVSGPVQLVWTREDDTKHDFYRPATFHSLKGGVGPDGMPSVVLHQQAQAGRGRGRDAGWGNGTEVPYRYADNRRIQHAVACPVPTGAWRSVDHTHLIFVIESFFDELCHLGGQDPVKARLAMMTNERLKLTLEVCAEKAEWGKSMPKGKGMGVACFAGYGSFITQIAEVTVTDGEVKVDKVTAVVDCGLAVNPLGIEAQIEGAVMDAVSTTLGAKITIQNGGVREINFGDYGWGRISAAPKVVTHIFADGDAPGGMGEVGYPAAGPAIANAIFAATGTRIRQLPVREQLA